jgi:hypothetical protein
MNTRHDGEWQDLNLRPPLPERGALPDCATLRLMAGRNQGASQANQAPENTDNPSLSLEEIPSDEPPARKAPDAPLDAKSCRQCATSVTASTT